MKKAYSFPNNCCAPKVVAQKTNEIGTPTNKIRRITYLKKTKIWSTVFIFKNPN